MLNIINEDSRSQLVTRSKNSDKERDGKTRYQKRVNSRVIASVSKLNRINMDQLFKDNILTVDLEVIGETDTYDVKISFGGFIDELNQQLVRNDVLDLRAIIRALVNAFNRNDVYTHCSCPDFKYRQNYWSTRNKFNSGEPELRPSDKTNPNDTKGPGCKHIMKVLSDTSWLIKIASVIKNYITYIEHHYERLYQMVIYPAIYDREWEEPIQLEIDPSDTLDTRSSTIDAANAEARKRGQFKPGHQGGVQFASTKPNPQLSIDDLIIDEE